MIWALLAIVVLAALCLLMILPASVAPETRRRFAGRYAHRGLHDIAEGVPENTLRAFELAVAGGYGIELDVQLSRDGQVVVFHDDTLDRLCERKGPLSDVDWPELSQLRLAGTEHTMPLFSDVLAGVAGRVPLIVELKTGRTNDALCRKTMDLLRDYRGTYCVESFNPLIVNWFRKNEPSVIRGQLSASFPADEMPSPLMRIILTNMLLNCLARPQFIAYAYEHRKNLAFRIARRLFGAFTVAWTVRDATEEQKIADDFDMVIFEGYRP